MSEAGVDRSGFSATSAKSDAAALLAEQMLDEAIDGAEPESVLPDVVPPTIHIVGSHWGPLRDLFRGKGVQLKRRKVTDEERAAHKITSDRPRFFISATILPVEDAGAGAGAGAGAPKTAKKAKTKRSRDDDAEAAVEEPATGAKKRVMSCSVCKAPGHTKSKCETSKPEEAAEEAEEAEAAT